MQKRGRPDTGARTTEKEARRRKEVALAELRELEVAQQRGLLLRRGDVERTWAETAAMLRDAVLRIPDMAAPQLVGLRDGAEALAVLSDVCDHVLRTVGDRLVAASGGATAEAGGSAETARAAELGRLGRQAQAPVQRGKRGARVMDDAAIPARGAGRARSAQQAQPRSAHVGKPVGKD